MRVIFLDVDGVLNSVRSMVALHNHRSTLDHDFIDPIAVALVNKLIERSRAHLVISSTHRKHIPDPLGNGRSLADMQKYFDKFGIVGKVIGYTPCSKDGHRGTEIKQWLEDNKGLDVTEYVIIDDDCDMLEEQLPYFVHTDNYFGFSYLNYLDALRILNSVDFPN